MERDFLGLNSKNDAMASREDFSDSSKNSGMQWAFSNKVSALPQLLSFKAAQDEKQRKIVVDPLVSSDLSNLTHRPYSSVIQKNVVLDKKAGNQYAMAVYPFQNGEAISVHRSQDVKMFPISNQTKTNNAVPVAFNVPVFQSQLVSSGQAVVGSNVNLQFGGVPIATSVSVPFTSSVIGSTELRNASKPPGSTPQLTIFYAGSASFPNENFQGMPLLGLSSPPSVAHSKSPNAGLGSCSKIELPAAPKRMQTPASHSNYSEPPKDARSIAPIATTFIPAAVPQARKASLTRFLEKRKERLWKAILVALQSSTYSHSKA
ncbi:Protein TIFY 6B [Cucurbita argyrosperma subsp. argyrosperma]|nr:Protein TIFY 6B [Cucurbita argyrosperma subsp. argyrosperma]